MVADNSHLVQFIRSVKIDVFPPAKGEATEMDMKYIFLMSGVTEANLQ